MEENEKPQMKKKARMFIAIVGIIIAAVVVVVGGYFVSPVWTTKTTATQVDVAKASDIPVGTPTQVTYSNIERDGWITKKVSHTAWIVTQDGQTFTAFDPHCTHLGCPYYWNAGENCFVCPCHGGEFDINGNVIAGPPPRALDQLGLVVTSAGQIELTGQVIKGE